MIVCRFDALPHTADLRADVVIVGGGACGLSVAHELIGSGLSVVVVESGLMSETREHAALNTVDVGEVDPDSEFHAARAAFRTYLKANWSAEQQRYGLRCRGLGGSTMAWSGKSALFDDLDFAARPWVPNSGWPIARSELVPYVDRAADLLNLAPIRDGEKLWSMLGHRGPEPRLDETAFVDFLWQLSRSRYSFHKPLRMGPEFLALDAPNVRVLLNATATRLLTDVDGNRFRAVEVANLDDRSATIRARACVLAASAIENARLLLLSADAARRGLGNGHGLVGQFLIDHAIAPLGRYDADGAAEISRRFGKVEVQDHGQRRAYLLGLALAAQRQRNESLVNGSVFIAPQRAFDDPLDALRRLLRWSSEAPGSDAVAVARDPGRLGAAIAVRLAKLMGLGYIEAALANGSATVRRRRSGEPYAFAPPIAKLSGAEVYGVVEQVPIPERRVTLSDRRDTLGLQLPHVEWFTTESERATMLRMGQLLGDSLERTGLPKPDLEEWITAHRPDRAILIDHGHSMGTTRMSETPATGVVNTECRLHDVEGLYAIGGSVMPTAGHANPTLMMVALAIRLADHLRRTLPGAPPMAGGSATTTVAGALPREDRRRS